MVVLDHGYVTLVTKWGSEEGIIEAARMSTDKGFQGWGGWMTCNSCGEKGNYQTHTTCTKSDTPPTFSSVIGDERLLSYLYTHKHMTPFEMAGMTIEVQAPIFVMREWHRHRTMSYNELSARYTQLPDLFYIPSIERLMNSKQGKMNKQGSIGGFTKEQAQKYRAEMEIVLASARGTYELLLANEVSREVARMVIPVTQYSRMRASANLRNWLQFLSLRLGEGVQWEMAEYARTVEAVVKQEFPRVWELFNEGVC